MSVSLLFRRVLVVLCLLFLVLLAFSLSAPRQVASQQDAVRTVMDDIASDPAVQGHKYLASVFSSSLHDDGQWEVIVKLTLEPNSACPQAFIRTYQLLPIRHGVDKVITQDCKRSGSLAFAEEAILASVFYSEVSRAISQGATSCAYQLPLERVQVLEYCPGVDFSEISSFASTLPIGSKWLVEWRAQGADIVRLAFDSKANRLA